MRDTLLEWLEDLDGVWQPPRFHPEGDALTHSLQVFDRALAATRDPELHTAALLHDIGKSMDIAEHAELGADLLDGVFSERVTRLVRHHMDLLRRPRQTRRHFANTPFLRDLELLRRLDLAGRVKGARTIRLDHAVELILEYMNAGAITPPDRGLAAMEDAP